MSGKSDHSLDGNWAMWQLAIINFTREHCKPDDRHHRCSEDVVDLTSQLLGERRQHAQDEQRWAQELDDAQSMLRDTERRLQEAQGLRTSLESVVSERLAAQLAADKRAGSLADEITRLQSSRSELQAAVDDGAAQTAKEHERFLAEARRAKELEAELADVENFLNSDVGKAMARMENELAQARLQLAEVESEKDELELELSALSDFQQAVSSSECAEASRTAERERTATRSSKPGKGKEGGTRSRSPLRQLKHSEDNARTSFTSSSPKLVRGWLSQHAGIV